MIELTTKRKSSIDYVQTSISQVHSMGGLIPELGKLFDNQWRKQLDIKFQVV